MPKPTYKNLFSSFYYSRFTISPLIVAFKRKTQFDVVSVVMVVVGWGVNSIRVLVLYLFTDCFNSEQLVFDEYFCYYYYYRTIITT